MPEHILLMNRRPPRGRVPPQLRPYLFKKKHHSRRGKTYTVKAHRVSESHGKNRRPHKVRAHFVRTRSGGRTYVASHRSNRRHNPRSLGFGAMVKGVPGEFVAALIGAVGAIGIEWGWSKLAGKLPAQLQTGWGAVAAEAGLTLGVGYGLSKTKVVPQRMIAAGVIGSLVVISYSALKPLIAAKLNLTGLRDYQLYPGARRMAAYIPSNQAMLPGPGGGGGVGAYIPGNAIQNPAAAIRGVMGPGVGGIAPSY